MLPAERQTAIFHHVEARGSARTTALAREFGVTDKTIRKDLECLEWDGRVLRVHGGAVRNTNHRHELPLPERQALNRAEKILVARAACSLVKPRWFPSERLDTPVATADVLRGSGLDHGDAVER